MVLVTPVPDLTLGRKHTQKQNIFICFSRLNEILWDCCQVALCPASALSIWKGK